MPSKSGQLNEEDLIAPRRVRHITSIQVRNLTPFPVRDDSASALVQPSEQPQFSAHGHLSDDLDVTLARKRGRRRSSASVQSMFAHEALDGSPISKDVTGRQRAMSRASTGHSSSVGPTSTPKTRSSAGPPPTRPPHRARTLSTASSISHVSTGTTEHPVTASRTFPGLLRDTSQTALEKVLQSRLVETFLIITIPPPEDAACDMGSSSVSTMRKDGQSTESAPQLSRRNTVVASGSNGVPSLSAPPRRGTLSKLTSSARAGPSHSRAASTSAVAQSKPAPKPSAPQTLPRSAASHPRTSSKAAVGSVSRPTTPDSGGQKEEPPAIPDFFSPVHRPSTNPAFSIDAREHFDFASNTDLSGTRMTLEIWGKVVDPALLGHKGKGKERARDVEDAGMGHQGDEWKVLEHWDVNLNELIPLPDDLINHPSRIPSNTLCVTLDPPGQTFYLPSARSALVAPPRSRSPSPSAGYNSDGESGVRKSAPSSATVHFEAKSHGVSPRHLDPQLSRRKGDKKSATWRDLVRLVDLQAVIKDTASSLSDVVREIDHLVTSNETAVLAREASERDAWVAELRGEVDAVEAESRSLKHRLAAKREDLRRRRALLEAARQAHEDDLQQEADASIVLRLERDQLAQLRRRLPVMRNSLITSLAFVFPIELLSPPDLLFTVLGVPLPIPNGPTDPAPPLALPAHRDVNEDSVATALGYAAQVVQLLAAYLGIGLVYPVTCVGSRSLIKDGISAMVGPRMFPLFSKGVDTYRFEYAVFLLNKDIEMLMAERNLRALDMRHTLPNLKNLLLTLTDPDVVQTMPLRPPSVASATISALQSPVITPSTLTADGEPPSLSSTEAGPTAGGEHDADSPPASGAATPTKTADATTPSGMVRKSRGFLDLAPLSGFFKARYPSSSRGPSKAEEPPPPDEEPAPHAGDATPTIASARHAAYPVAADAQAEGSGGEDVEDDRRTIRASTSEEDGGGAEHKGRARVQAGRGALANGNGAAHHGPAAGVGEKVEVADALRAPAVVDGVS